MLTDLLEKKSLQPRKAAAKLHDNTLQLPIFLMNMPYSFDTKVRNNVWMDEYSDEDIKVNLEKATREMLEMYSFLSGQGVVYLLPTPINTDLQDLVYVANNGIVLPHLEAPTFIASNFHAENRRGEEVIRSNFFSSLGYDIHKSPAYFEGEAELKFLRDNIYFGGYGIRSSKEAYDWMSSEFNMNIIQLEMSDPYAYHLDCSLFVLSDEKVLVSVDEFSKKDIKKIEKVAEIIPITIDQAHAGINNSVRVNNYIMNASDIDFLKAGTEDYKYEKDKNNRLEQIAADNAMEVCYFCLEEYMKGGGLLSCMVLNVNYQSYKQKLL